MSKPTTVSPEQSAAFRSAICARLGIDPALVSESGFDVSVTSGENFGEISLTALLPADELVEMFNAAGR